jgi:hypothetical protein
VKPRTIVVAALAISTAVAVPLLAGESATGSPARPATAGLTASTPQAALAAAHSRKLLVRYATKSTCTIYPNYPKAGVVGNSGRTWTIAGGQTIIWRYNVNRTWAAVSDPRRASAKQFPWWGFTHRACIGRSVRQQGYPAGRPVPNRILSGRSQHKPYWRPVDFSVAPAAVRAHHRRVKSAATLRDGANFVIGNVFADWHVDVTTRTRSHGHWVEVYVPNARRWGYIEAGNLR